MDNLNVLIVTGFESLEGFQLPMENRTLLWGLDQLNISWSLYNPWKPMPNLLNYDAVLITVYRSHNKNFVYYCKKFEVYAKEQGIPVINTVENAHSFHSFYLSTWRDHGVPCARFQRFRSVDDLTLDTYPMIIRRDGVHRGTSMHFAQNRSEAEEIIKRQHDECSKSYPDARGQLPVDLAIEFVETSRIDGYYCKWRCYVVGDQVIPAHFMRSISKFVNYKDAALWAQTCSLDAVYGFEGEPYPERVLQAARATGFDIIALDYSVKEDGSYIFWEGNRIRATAGDVHVRWLREREEDIKYGIAVAKLIRQRVAQFPGRKKQAKHKESKVFTVGAADPKLFIINQAAN